MKAGLAGVFTWHMLLDVPYSSPDSLVRAIDETMGKTTASDKNDK
jgi:hypothetical protein